MKWRERAIRLSQTKKKRAEQKRADGKKGARTQFGHHNSIIFFFLPFYPIFSSCLVRALHSMFFSWLNCALCAAPLRQCSIHIFHLKKEGKNMLLFRLYLSPSYWNIYIVFNAFMPILCFHFVHNYYYYTTPSSSSSSSSFSSSSSGLCLYFSIFVLNQRLVFDFKRNGKWMVFEN